MCGIFGWHSLQGPLTERQLQDARHALTSLSHRGPDNGSEWTTDSVYMGHRRLAVIDLSAEANQPFEDPTGRWRLSYNGEVYNYIEIRKELRREGIQFRTNSDTEVVLAALVHWGRQALLRFDGMFAGAFYDRQDDTLLLFRDPLGQKPLYVHASENALIYSSELRSFFNLGGFRWQLDAGNIQRFLVYSYFPWDTTPLVGVSKLLPGCWLELANGRVQIGRYWDSRPGDDPLDISEDEAIVEFERLFDASCQRSMRSDAPYGVFLSGGIDSSLVLASCRSINSNVRTFSVSMGETDFDESHKADSVNRQLAIDQSWTFRMDEDSIESAIDGFFRSNDEPHGDPGFVNSYFLAQAARPHLTVALAGDGGDELFSGYLPFAGLWAAPVVNSLPRSVLSAIKSIVSFLPETDRYLDLRFKLDAYFRGFPANDAQRFARWLSTIDQGTLNRLAPSKNPGTSHPSFDSLHGFVETLLNNMPDKTSVQALLYFYQKVFLPEFVCLHTDRAAMQFGLEVRSPFLSLPLIEFANKIPDRLKLRGRELKWLLRRSAARRGLSPEIVRQRKQGFTFPIARWLKGRLQPRVKDMAGSDEWSSGLIDMREARRLCEDHVSGRRNNYRIVWNLLVLKAWREKYPSLEIERCA